MFAMNHHLSSIHDRLVSRRFLISRRLRAGACVINPTLYRRGRAGRCIHFRTSRFNNGRVCVISGWVVAANRVRCGCCMQRRKGWTMNDRDTKAKRHDSGGVRTTEPTNEQLVFPRPPPPRCGLDDPIPGRACVPEGWQSPWVSRTCLSLYVPRTALVPGWHRHPGNGSRSGFIDLPYPGRNSALRAEFAHTACAGRGQRRPLSPDVRCQVATAGNRDPTCAAAVVAAARCAVSLATRVDDRCRGFHNAHSATASRWRRWTATSPLLPHIIALSRRHRRKHDIPFAASEKLIFRHLPAALSLLASARARSLDRPLDHPSACSPFCLFYARLYAYESMYARERVCVCVYSLIDRWTWFRQCSKVGVMSCRIYYIVSRV